MHCLEMLSGCFQDAFRMLLGCFLDAFGMLVKVHFKGYLQNLLQVEIKRAEPRTFHINGNSIKEQATQQQQIPEQWATVQQNGAGPHIIGPAPQNNWSSSYPIWNQPPPSTPPAPQWTAYASPPPPPVSSVAPPFYPAPAVTPTNFWAMQGQTQSSTEQQFSQKISFYGAPPTGPAAPPPPPTYPTQYPKAAQYPNEYFTALSAGGVTNTAPMVAYTTPSLGGRGPAAAATPGTLFTTQQQVTSSQSYHPYRRQP